MSHGTINGLFFKLRCRVNPIILGSIRAVGDNNWHRFYDPGTGRYISADPIGLAGGMNLYAYVQNDSVNWVDPWGLYTEIIIWQPVTWTSSSFGHVSSNVNGTNYSWTPDGWDTNPSASNYAQRQERFRSGVGSNSRYAL